MFEALGVIMLFFLFVVYTAIKDFGGIILTIFIIIIIIGIIANIYW